MRRSASRLNIYRGCPNFFWVNFWECSGWFADLWLMRIYWLICACHVVCEACPWQGSPWCTSQCEKTRRSGTFRSWQQDIFFQPGTSSVTLFWPVDRAWALVNGCSHPQIPKTVFSFQFWDLNNEMPGWNEWPQGPMSQCQWCTLCSALRKAPMSWWTLSSAQRCLWCLVSFRSSLQNRRWT